MSKTTLEKKAKKAKEFEKVEAPVNQIAPEREAQLEVEGESAQTPVENPTVEVLKVAHKRGKKYQNAKKKIDAVKYYPLPEAIKLVQETSISSFDGKIEAHITASDLGQIGEIAFPHMETGDKKIVILNDTILAEIKEGKVNFDILIATPATMPKLLPFARLLGPKGLMPNPKNGTLTDKPEEAVKRLAVAKTPIKTEKKAPVIHIVVGKVSQPAKEIEANITELIKVVKINKIKKLALCATMGPSVKVQLDK